MPDTSLSSAISDKLLLTPREASQVLSVCEKTLWSLTVPRGTLKCCRLGRSVRYSPDSLREFIQNQQAESSREVSL